MQGCRSFSGRFGALSRATGKQFPQRWEQRREGASNNGKEESMGSMGTAIVRRMLVVVAAAVLFASVSPHTALAAFLTDPPVTVTQTSPDTWESVKDLDYPPWYGRYLYPNGADAMYAGESATYTSF